MEDSEMRQMVIAAVNECEDIELLDLIYRILASEARNGGGIAPAVFIFYLSHKQQAPPLIRSRTTPPWELSILNEVRLSYCYLLVLTYPP